MFPSLAARETYVAAWKQKLFLPADKNILVSRTQILRVNIEADRYNVDKC